MRRQMPRDLPSGTAGIRHLVPRSKRDHTMANRSSRTAPRTVGGGGEKGRGAPLEAGCVVPPDRSRPARGCPWERPYSIYTATNGPRASNDAAGAASLLDHFDIAHPGTEAGPAVWRAYLTHIIDAAEDGDIARAKAVRAEFQFDNQSGGFNAPSGAPLPEGQIHGPSGVSVILEESRLRRQVDDNAGITSDGKEIAKLILRAPDLDEAERIYTQYKRASHPEGRLFERFVHKAYSYRLDAAGDRNKADEFYDVVESQDKDSVREDIEFAFLVDEINAADVDGTGKPREEQLKAASQNPGGGIHIAKLISEALSLEEANEVWDIFKDAPVQTNKGSPYAAYAHALVRFNCCLAASDILREADMEGVSQQELEAAMDRFYFPQDDEGQDKER